MTHRDFYSFVIANTTDTEARTFAEIELAKLDAKNEKRRNTLTKNQQANVVIADAILAYVADHKNALASEIATACEISTQKVSALAKQMIANGTLTASTVKVKGKGELKAYSVV